MTASKKPASIAGLMVFVIWIALVLAMLRGADPLRLSLTVVLLGFGGIWVYIPVRLHARHELPADPNFLPCGPEDPNTPAAVAERFRQGTSALVPLGFTPRGVFRKAKPSPLAIGFVGLFEKPSTLDLARLLVVINPLRTIEILVFQTTFADGIELITANNQTLPHLPSREGMLVATFPDVHDPVRLLALHRKRVDRRGAIAIRTLPVLDGGLTAYLRDFASKELSRQVEMGYYRLDEASDVYRPTWKGACLITWKQLWPVGAIRRALRRWRAARMIRDLETA
jgi:hypothetical protein